MFIKPYKTRVLCYYKEMENTEKLAQIRHSLAHLLGASILELYPGSKLTLGPAVDNGFYYDVDVAGKINEEDLKQIEKKMREIIAERQPFLRDEIPEADALELAYKAVQDTPVVAQSAYNSALGTNWDDTKAFATIYTGSLKQPSFNFVPGTSGAAFNSVLVSAKGSGYLRPPSATISRSCWSFCISIMKPPPSGPMR